MRLRSPMPLECQSLACHSGLGHQEPLARPGHQCQGQMGTGRLQAGRVLAHQACHLHHGVLLECHLRWAALGCHPRHGAIRHPAGARRHLAGASRRLVHRALVGCLHHHLVLLALRQLRCLGLVPMGAAALSVIVRRTGEALARAIVPATVIAIAIVTANGLDPASVLAQRDPDPAEERAVAADPAAEVRKAGLARVAGEGGDLALVRC